MKKLIAYILFIFILTIGSAQNPGLSWMQYNSPEEAGWSSEKLKEVQKFSKEIGSSAFMIIQDGKIVDQWGEPERRFMCHSVRKSLLSALYGIHVDKGTVNINKTMADLEIDDIHQLTEIEKTAKISDLLKARSGVYHSAAYETASMKKARPKRGSHQPGTFWYYNNWDFNTLCHILMMHTEADFFEDFKNRIADPLQMQDFRLEDCYYHLEAENSKYPAYPFRMSARDLARVGQLFLQKGNWNDEQLISEAWVKESTSPYSENTRADGRGYAYLWWTGIYGDEHLNYSAQGVGNQAIIVYPEDNVVIVNRANTFLGKSVRTNDLIKLTKMVFEARKGKAKSKPNVSFSQSRLEKYLGEYSIDGQAVEIKKNRGKLMLYRPGSGKFYLTNIGKNKFRLEDAHYTLEFEVDENDELTQTAKITREP